MLRIMTQSVNCVMLPSVGYEWKLNVTFACFLITNRAPWVPVAPLDLLENLEMM